VGKSSSASDGTGVSTVPGSEWMAKCSVVRGRFELGSLCCWRKSEFCGVMRGSGGDRSPRLSKCRGIETVVELTVGSVKLSGGRNGVVGDTTSAVVVEA
jgi:hypothetical protein